MMIKIGTKIKELRKKKHTTQNTLAEYLGVTVQAISRWESEVCYPDIEILPAIADFFDVSLDELLAANQSQKESDINKYIEKANKEQMAGNFATAVSVFREAVSRYPSSYKLQAFLASAIGCIDNGVKIPLESANEVINICRRILADCVDDAIRYQAFNILCWVYYRQLGKLDKALQIVAGLPTVYGCQEFLKAETLEIRMPCEEAEKSVYALVSALLITFDKGEFAYCNDKKVMLKAAIIELNKLLFKLNE